MRDIGQQVSAILDGMADHEAERRKWEAELAELERTHRAEVEKARREYEARHRGGDGGPEVAAGDHGQDETGAVSGIG
jgi:hypothetical protein